MILLLPLALLILAAYGVWAIITATFNPWHWLVMAGAFGAVVLVFHLLWVLIGNMRK
jgi:hypothetical protein